jgi:hypothetical protein
LTRLYHVLDLVNKLLEQFHPIIRVIEHYAGTEEDSEYLNIRISFPQIGGLVVIREYLQRGNLVAYGYYLQIKGYEEWWDNRPHHPEIPTHPHHRHIGREVHPLPNPSLEDFLKRVRSLLQQIRGQ